MFSKVAIVALAAGAQVSFAAPLTQEQRSLKAVGTALVGGAASLITGSLLNNKRDESGVLVDTETGTLYMDVPDAPESRSLSAIENFFKNLKREEGVDARSLSAIENFFKNLKRDAPEARSLSAIENFFKNLKRDGDLDARSLSAIENFFGNLKRSESGVFVDSETGTLYMDVPDAVEGRSLKAIGTAVAGGIASGVAGAVAKDIFNKRSEPSGLMVDTETGTLYMDIPDTQDARSLKAIGTAVAGGIASGVAGAVAKDIFNKRSEPSGLMVDTDTGVIYMDVPDANEARSLKAIGTAIAGAGASFITGQILNNKRSDVFVDSETGTIFMDVPDANEDRSLSAIENFFKNLKREEPEARSISAIENFFKNLKREESEARSLSAIENFFKNLKREEPETRSLSAIENFFKNLKRSELEESMAKRAINDLE
ncbi:hypothetical protein PENSPDRAFT_449717 [Peniophora sp. CONT]|nr:hypothetical protein PENSPDRAFT_449717 [Peniophora sp. CONT]